MIRTAQIEAGAAVLRQVYRLLRPFAQQIDLLLLVSPQIGGKNQVFVVAASRQMRSR